MPELTAARLRELLRYDPETGLFTWAVNVGARAKIGAVAGSVKDGYRRIALDGRSYYAHKLAWLHLHGAWSEMIIDHKNGDRADNCTVNLREVDAFENRQNRGVGRPVYPTRVRRKAALAPKGPERGNELTIERLRWLLSYDKDTGQFVRNVAVANAKAGDIAGCIPKKGYHVVGVDGELYYTHRLAVFYVLGRWPFEEVDHIDGDFRNNRWSNLREATRLQNQYNVGITAKNKTGYVGVAYYKRDKNYHIQYQREGKLFHVGYFKTAKEGRIAYLQAVNYRGNFNPQRGEVP